MGVFFMNNKIKHDYYKIARPFIPSIMYGLLFIALLIIFKPSLLIISIVVVLLSLFFAYRKGDGVVKALKSAVKNVLWLLLIVFTYRILGTWGLLGPVIAVLLVVGVILYRRRKVFMSTIRDVEKLIWGRTNDKQKK
jgi:predicted membrane protein